VFELSAVPGFIYLLAVPKAPRPERAKAVALAAAVMVLLVAPYLVNCGRTFSDPFYSINAHADVYRATEGQSVEVSRTAREYLTAEARARPLRTLDTVVLGMTRYPFDNKWHGFEPWGPGRAPGVVYPPATEAPGFMKGAR
jgi:hypothetical protein